MGLDYDGTQLSYQTNPSFTSLRHSSPAPMPSTNNSTFQNQSAICRSVPVNTESLSWDRVHSLPTRSQSPYSFTPGTQGNYHAVYNRIQRSSTHYGGRQLCDLGPNASDGHGPGNFTLNQDYVWHQKTDPKPAHCGSNALNTVVRPEVPPVNASCVTDKDDETLKLAEGTHTCSGNQR